eukprot:SAG25_NODE_55_length_18625_cov_548.233726_5_plen_35_part_00
MQKRRRLASKPLLKNEATAGWQKFLKKGKRRDVP